MKPEEVKALRTKHGLTQQQMANLAGVQVRAVQHWEHGTAKPTPQTIELLLLKLDEVKQ